MCLNKITLHIAIKQLKVDFNVVLMILIMASQIKFFRYFLFLFAYDQPLMKFFFYYQ